MSATPKTDMRSLKKKGTSKLFPSRPRIAVGMGTCGIGNGAQEIHDILKKALKKKKIDLYLTQTGCFGFCAREPLVNVYFPGKALYILSEVSTKDIPQIINNIQKGSVPKSKVLCKIEKWDHLTHSVNYGSGLPEIPAWDEVPFFKYQKKIVLRNAGIINPEDIEEYAAIGGYEALNSVLKASSPEEVIEEIKGSGLRGRGGAGFPTGRKWEIMKNIKADEKFIVCNADEGDPGAYMNRNEIESDPHSLLEGMLIGAFAMGAREGIIYARAEYPLAVKRLKLAITQARQAGLLGEKILDSDFSFDITVVEGAGAFVCGEETALIASLEGNSGRPRPRPPFPAQKGLYEKPTTINNVETWCNIPAIIKKGSGWFKSTGSQNSAGTKVFSLVGKIKNTGLVELPLGSPLETIVYDIGGGSEAGRKIKSVQTGGPSGGCIPSELFKTPVDYESLTGLGAIMGSGGMVVMDEDNCMVDVARYFTEFTTSESCGKCTPCREGLHQELKILKAICEGRGTRGDFDRMRELGDVIKDTALCGLGQTGPNPALTTLLYFKNEYDQHIKEGRCHAGVCESLFLSPCENSCPLHMNVPAFIELYKDGRIKEAFLSIIQDNPLPAIAGRVCHHPCVNRCRRSEIDHPIAQRYIHGFIAEEMYKKGADKEIFDGLVKKRLPATGKRIAIAGSGPAGLSAAFYLSRLGHKVDVYESKARPGGMLALTIPRYRLPGAIVSREIENIASLGVKFIFNKRIGSDIPLKKLSEKYDALFLAVGAWNEMRLGIPGEDARGVVSGIEFLESSGVKKVSMKGQKAVIIGGGNVAVDAARTALRFGADVTIAYRRERSDMPANIEEIQEAEAEGVKIVFLSAPERIKSDGNGTIKELHLMRMTPGDYDLSGRRRPVPSGKSFALTCDKVILGIGERVDSAFTKESGVVTRKNGSIETEPFTYRTGHPKIYAGGDAATGPATVTEAMASGKYAAKVIDADLMAKGRFDTLFERFSYSHEVSLEPQGCGQLTVKKVSAVKRVKNFKEVLFGFSSKQIQKEMIRCLRCDVKV